MRLFDLLVRHMPADEQLAVSLSEALAAFGYRVRCAAQNEEFSGIPWLVLWSPSAAVDDDFCWECAEVARESGQQTGKDEIYLAVAGGVRSRPGFPEFGSYGPNSRPRLRRWLTTNLSDWTGSAQDERLAPLLWELPPPQQPNDNPPLSTPSNFSDMRWREAKASRNIAWMGEQVTQSVLNKLSPEEAQNRIASIRELGSIATSWARYGVEAAAAAKAGRTALHNWGHRVRERYRLPNVEDQKKALEGGTIEGLLLAVQICAGDGFERLSRSEHRSIDELAALAQRGDADALASFARGQLTRPDLVSIVEQRASNGDAAAMYALATSYSTPEHRQRLLLERAGNLGHAESFCELGRLLDRQRFKSRDAVAAWRRGAELGDKSCQWRYACALDVGKHVRRSAQQAFALYQTLKDWEPEAELRMAQMLWDGDGVERDRKTAVSLFFEIALRDGGLYQPLIYIGDLYRLGLGGMRVDLDEAKAWYVVATYANFELFRAIGGDRLKAMGVAPETEEPWPAIDDLDPEEQQEARSYWAPRA